MIILMPSNRTQTRLFIVEDSGAIRDRYRAEVQTMPHLTLCGEAVNASGAIDGILRESHDVVLLDLELEQGTGLDVLEALADSNQHLSVVVVTNHVEPQMRERCFHFGATHFFDKNRQFLELLEFLERL